MELTVRWPQLQALCFEAEAIGGLEVWAFGSALREASPRDLDILLVYTSRASVVALRSAGAWDESAPPCHLIAMTRDEEREYEFIRSTGAVQLL